MKRFFLFLFVTIAALACKKDTEPADVIGPIIGTWDLHSQEIIVDGKSEWAIVNQAPGNERYIGSDGIMKNAQGLAECCYPSSLEINGIFFQVRSSETTTFAHCSAIKCSGCDVWKVETNGNEITISGCNRIKSKYLRR